MRDASFTPGADIVNVNPVLNQVFDVTGVTPVPVTFGFPLIVGGPAPNLTGAFFDVTGSSLQLDFDAVPSVPAGIPDGNGVLLSALFSEWIPTSAAVVGSSLIMDMTEIGGTFAGPDVDVNDGADEVFDSTGVTPATRVSDFPVNLI